MAYNNISKLFFEDYYKDVDFSFVLSGRDASEKTIKAIKQMNDKIKRSDLYSIKKPIDNIKSFQAKILYPGLITGVGLVHDSKKIKGGYNLGMHFDYTTGMPIVYGSSVKGVLSSYFKEFYDGSDAEALHDAIFEGKDPNGKPLPMYKRDVFFDAVLIKTYGEGSRSYFLVDDNITPHTEGPLKNPIPITMLKIAAGCILEFRFLLRPTQIDGKTYNEDKKLEIFKKILVTVGVGAKTNVGYGQLTGI